MSETRYGAISLRVEVIKALSPIIHLFQESEPFWYWKADNTKLLLSFFKYHSKGATYIEKEL